MPSYFFNATRKCNITLVACIIFWNVLNLGHALVIYWERNKVGLCCVYVFFFLIGCTWKFPGQGSNPSHSCDLCRSCGKQSQSCSTVGTFVCVFIFIFNLFFGGGAFFRATPAAYESSRLGFELAPQLPAYATAMWDVSHFCDLHPDNAGSLTHWVRPGSEPASFWILVGFVTHWDMMGTLFMYVFFNTKYFVLQLALFT